MLQVLKASSVAYILPWAPFSLNSAEVAPDDDDNTTSLQKKVHNQAL